MRLWRPPGGRGKGRRPPLPWPPWLPAALTPRGVWQHRSGPFAWPCVSVAPSSCEDPVIRAPLLQRGRLVTNHMTAAHFPKETAISASRWDLDGGWGGHGTPVQRPYRGSFPAVGFVSRTGGSLCRARGVLPPGFPWECWRAGWVGWGRWVLADPKHPVGPVIVRLPERSGLGDCDASAPYGGLTSWARTSRVRTG